MLHKNIVVEGATHTMAAAQTTKAVPTDAEVMMAILKDMGVSDYEPRLVNQMLEFTYRKFRK